MSKVLRLPSDLANQIAAGEVVERPASVVKELVENALDAGAARVTIEIDHGGLARVRVTDDGDGMTPEDAELSLERHATSKIAKIEDLAHLGSFGFRGEALPSIASVSKLTLTTRARGADFGTLVEIAGGGAAVTRPAGCAVGTSVEVSDLFFNVPARRKFLKATATESAHVGDVVLLAALARPEVTFVLNRDGKTAREHLRAASRAERAKDALGGEVLSACIAEKGSVRIEAHLARPERSRAGATGLHLLVNGRPVKDRLFARAVAQAYGSILEPGRYPVGVVYVDLPPELVDVNVHPQKAEVRFADARGLFDVVTRELYGALCKAFAIPALGPPSRPWLPPPRRDGLARGGAPLGDPAGAIAEVLRGPWGEQASEDPPLAGTSEDGQFYRRLRFLAQIRATFLVCEGDDGIYILDQHAAAERVTFDELRRAFQARSVAAQRLLLPELVELTPLEIAALEEHADHVRDLGVELRATGPSTVAVHAIPRVLVRAHPERVVRDLAAELSRAAARPFGASVDRVLATMACHGSVRAGDAISPDEAKALLEALDRVDFSGHCPHGRPVITRLGYDDLERRVGR